MTRDGFFTGLDIGTSSIKVLVAEHRDGEVNVIGVSNAKSKGVKDGIIVDIEAAASAIKSAITQAEEKAGISIKSVNVGLPANLLQVLGAQMSREETMYASLGHLKIFTQYLTRDFNFVLSNKPLFLKQVFKGIEIVSLFVLVELIILTVLNPVLKLSLSLERV